MPMTMSTTPLNTLVLQTQPLPGVCLLTLNRPEARNALNDALRKELSQAVALAANDPEIRVIVITGEGESFAAGADLKEIAGDTPRGHSPSPRAFALAAANELPASHYCGC